MSPARAGARRERCRLHLRPDESEQPDDGDAANDNRGKRPPRCVRRDAAATNESALDGRHERVDRSAKEPCDAGEWADASRADRPIDATDRGGRHGRYEERNARDHEDRIERGDECTHARILIAGSEASKCGTLVQRGFRASFA